MATVASASLVPATDLAAWTAPEGSRHGPGTPSATGAPLCPSSSPARNIWRTRAGEISRIRAAS